MKRYFEIVGRKQTLALDLKPPVSQKSAAELAEQLKMPLRELCGSEYRKLTKVIQEKQK